IAAFFVGRATKRFGFTPLLMAGPPLLGAAYLGLWALDSYAALLLLLAAIGCAQGLTVTSLTALIALRAPRESAGAVFGVVPSITSFAFSGAPFVGGIVASALGLRAAFPVSALLALGMWFICYQATRRGVPEPLKAAQSASRPREQTAP